MTSRRRSLVTALAVCSSLVLVGCGGDDSESGGEHNESSREHDGEEGEHDREGSEESGTQYAKTDSYDETRGGARLTLSFAPDRDSFVGTVTNTTDTVLDQVRVEVHLSNGTELGPTNPSDLQPGNSTDIELSANGEAFETWSAHPEVGRDEHTNEGDEEHD